MPRHKRDFPREMEDFIVPDDEDEPAIEYDYGAIGRDARDANHQCADAYPEDTFVAAGSMARFASHPSTVASDTGIVFMQAFGQTVKPRLSSAAFVKDTQCEGHHPSRTTAVPRPRAVHQARATTLPSYRVTKSTKPSRIQVAAHTKGKTGQHEKRFRIESIKDQPQAAPQMSRPVNAPCHHRGLDDILGSFTSRLTQELRDSDFETPRKRSDKRASHQEQNAEEKKKKNILDRYEWD